MKPFNLDNIILAVVVVVLFAVAVGFHFMN